MDLHRTTTCAADLMGGPAVSVGPDATLGTVRQILAGHDVDHVLVVERSVLRGVVREAEVSAALSPYLDTASEQARDLQTLRRPVHQVMEHHPLTVRPDAPLEELGRLMASSSRGSCLVVVDATGHPLGTVTWRDLLAHFLPVVRPETTVPASRTPEDG